MSALRPWSGPADTVAMQQLASRGWPNGLHPGGLGWSQATGQLAADIVVVDHADDGPGLAGWAGLTQPGSLVLQVAPSAEGEAALGPLVAWLLGTADGPDLMIDSNDERISAALRPHGFTPLEPPFGYYGMGRPGLRAAVATVVGEVSSGFRIRSVRADEAVARVEVHRLAWRPADLPFAPGRGPEPDPAATSSFTLEHYRRVQASGLYDPKLDLVAEAPDGSLAGCCLGWLDPRTGWAEIEPLGIVPAHRRRGLAGALCAEIATRVEHLGGRQLFINTADSDRYPAPFAAYLKAGFTPWVRGETLGSRG